MKGQCTVKKENDPAEEEGSGLNQWDTRVQALSEMWSDEQFFYLKSQLTAWHNNEACFDKTWTKKIERFFVWLVHLIPKKFKRVVYLSFNSKLWVEVRCRVVRLIRGKLISTRLIIENFTQLASLRVLYTESVGIFAFFCRIQAICSFGARLQAVTPDTTHIMSSASIFFSK